MQTLGKESVLCVLQFNTAKYHEMIEHSESYCSYCCYTDHYSRMPLDCTELHEIQ